MNVKCEVAALAAVTAVGLMACSQAVAVETGGQTEIRLPAPKTTGGMTLNEALAKRRSHKSIAPGDVMTGHVSQLCWAAQGITEPKKGLRTAPSAHALYAITVYLIDETGLYEYVPEGHLLRRLREGDMLARLRAAVKQSSVETAPVCLVLTMNVERLAARDGKKAERFCLLEAGHVAQNVLLQVTALGLVSVPAGGIDEGKVKAALKLPENQRAVYALPIGYAKPQ
jgi:SagB-type dehydrogenase family enzyme